MIKRFVTLSLLASISLLALPQELTSGLLERAQIPEKYTWNTSDVYPDVESWNKDYTWIESRIPEYQSFAGRLGESPEVLLECLLFDEGIRVKLDYIWLYAKLHRDVEMQNEQAQDLWSRYNLLHSGVETARSFILPELITLPQNTLAEFHTELDGLKPYAYYFKTLEKKKAHTLSAQQEALLAKFSPILENPYHVFGSLVYSELPFPVIQDEHGEEILLTRTNSWRARSSQNKEFRKAGYQGYYNSLGRYQATLTNNLSGFVAGKVLLANTRDYPTALEASLDRYGLPVEIYHNLLQSVGSNLEACHRWMKIKKELLQLDTLHLYDTRVSAFQASERKISWEEAEALTMESLGVLGEDYLGSIRELYEKRWIDAFPNVGKETGGYSSGPAGPHPYVKMNWGDGLFDFYTLVHELGHYVHATKTMESQPYIYREYPSFLSEVASTTAENISQFYLIQTAENPEEKLYQIEQYLDNVVMNIYNACMMAEFELMLYETIESGATLSPRLLNEHYALLLSRYYGPDVYIDETDAYAWMEYPHYYLDYYLYSYATSFSAGVQIASDIREQGSPAVLGFMQFLEAGASDNPVAIVQVAGVDLTSPQPYEAVIKMMNELMDEIEKK